MSAAEMPAAWLPRSEQQGAEARAAAAVLAALPPGIHEGLDERVYHAKVPWIASKSSLDLVLRSPARYKAWLDGNERPETPALHLGTAVHMARLEPERFARTYVVAPDFGSLRKNDQDGTTTEQGKANKDRKAAWMAAHRDVQVLDAKGGATTLGMVRAIAAHPDAAPLFSGGIPEVTLIWTCPVTGLVCKARVDYWIPDLAIAVDLKSTTDAREWAFARSIEEYGYHRQAGHYSEGFRVLGKPIEQFVFIPVEKEAPFDLNVWELDADDVRDGSLECLTAKRRLAECIAADEWPGYVPGVKTICRPAWARKNRAA